jgi:signal transduction protein with GAF and PtsI domain
VAKIKDLEAKFARTEEQVRLFQKISRLMARDLSLQEVLHHIIGLITDFMHCDSCLIYLMDGHDLVLCAASNVAPNTIGKVRLKIGEGLTGWVARERRFVAISREAYLDPRFKHFSDLPEDTYDAFLSAPVIARNKVVGVLNVQHRAPHAFSGLEMELLTTVGEQIGCLLLLSRMSPSAIQEANHAELALSSTPMALLMKP